MKALVFGSTGFLGRHFLHGIEDAVGSTVDIADPQQLAKELDRHLPDVVINCAGKTGRPNVDWCESHQGETLRSNVTGPLVLLDACLRRKIFFVHLSSGCIFSGDNGGNGFSEADEPNFFGSYYVRTKIHADRLLAEFPVLILRPRMPFDNSLHERSLLIKLARYPRVLNEPNSYTYIPDLLAVANELIRQRRVGVYHTVNPGVQSPWQLMRKYRAIVDPSHSCEELTAAELGLVTSAGRSNCVLSTGKLAEQGIAMRPLDQALEEAFSNIRRLDSANDLDGAVD